MHLCKNPEIVRTFILLPIFILPRQAIFCNVQFIFILIDFHSTVLFIYWHTFSGQNFTRLICALLLEFSCHCAFSALCILTVFRLFLCFLLCLTESAKVYCF